MPAPAFRHMRTKRHTWLTGDLYPGHLHTQRLRSKRNTRAYARDGYPSLYTRIWGQFYLGL